MLENDNDFMGNLVASALFGYQEKINSDFEDDALADELAAQAVLPIAISSAPKEFQAKWRKRSNEIEAANMMVFYEHTQLHELMTENGIPYVILKGAASASYYPEPILRTMGDVDFLVKEQDLKRAGGVVGSVSIRSTL